MAFVRKVKTASGATAVQIVQKKYGTLEVLEHLGSAHSEAGLEKLILEAKKKLEDTRQRRLF